MQHKQYLYNTKGIKLYLYNTKQVKQYFRNTKQIGRNNNIHTMSKNKNKNNIMHIFVWYTKYGNRLLII